MRRDQNCPAGIPLTDAGIIRVKCLTKAERDARPEGTGRKKKGQCALWQGKSRLAIEGACEGNVVKVVEENFFPAQAEIVVEVASQFAVERYVRCRKAQSQIV